jgi:hypothetical protein
MMPMFTSNQATKQLTSVATVEQRYVLNQKCICALLQDQICIGKSQHATDIAIVLCDA